MPIPELPPAPDPTPTVEVRPYPYRFFPLVDAPLLASLGAVAGGSYLVELSPPREASGQTLPTTSGIDKASLAALRGRPLSSAETARTASDLVLYGTMGAPLLVGGLQMATGGRWNEELTTVGLAYESILVTWVATDVVKFAVGRPRPYVYRCIEESKVESCFASFDDEVWSTATGAETVLNEDAWTSFFSGHTSIVAAASFSVAHIVAQTGRRSAVRVVLPYAVATGLTMATGALRVEAGMHFPTDVIVGGIAGMGLGIAVPELHRVVPLPPVRLGLVPCGTPGSGGWCAVVSG